MIKLTKLVCIDLEATCWPTRAEQPSNERSEVIEIGVSILDTRTLNHVYSEGILVKPTMSKVSEFCTELTTLTQEQLDKDGLSFSLACQKLRYSPTGMDLRDYAWCSYGDYDRNFLTDQCRLLNVPFPLSGSHLNVKAMYNVLFSDRGSSIGLKGAIEEMGMKWKGTHHRGVSDAENVAALVAEIIKRNKEAA